MMVDLMDGSGTFENQFFVRTSIPRISTGSLVFDSLLGGGLPVFCVIDIFGASGTGMTQFCFQNLVTTSQYFGDQKETNAVFVDCAASFRPERIVEIAESRGLVATKILDGISSTSARSSADQFEIIKKIGAEASFSKCRL